MSRYPADDTADRSWIDQDNRLRVRRWCQTPGVEWWPQLPTGDAPPPKGFCAELQVDLLGESERLIGNDDVGVDLLRLDSEFCSGPVTRPYDAIFVVVGGSMAVTIDGRIYEVGAGQTAIVSADWPHALTTVTRCATLVVSAPSPVDGFLVEQVGWQELLGHDGSMHCTTCGQARRSDDRHLWELGCSHDPFKWEDRP